MSSGAIEELKARLAKAEEERDLYRAILDKQKHVTTLVVETEPFSKVVFGNKRFCEYNGVSYEKVITMMAVDFASTPDDDLGKLKEAITAVMSGREHPGFFSHFRGHGESENKLRSVWGHLSIQRMDRPAAPPRLLFTTIVTDDLDLENPALKGGEGSLRAIAAAATDPIIMLDEDGKVTYWNSYAEDLFGFMAVEALGKPLEELILPGKLRGAFRAGLERFGATGEGKMVGRIVETTAIKKDGAEFPVEVSISPIRGEGGRWRAAGFVRDITTRKRMETELVASMDRAVNANNLKDQFVALVSHDLRSPLGNVMGMLEVFKTKAKGAIKPEEMFYLNRAIENCNGLLGMINRLLDLSRLQSGKIKLRKRFITLRPFVVELVENVAHVAQEKGIQIKVDIPEKAKVFADDGLLSQALGNLLSNAVKFLRKGDTVTARAVEDQQWTIQVSDNGPGINEKILPNLFTHEVRTSTAGTKGEKGMGLGLPMCADIMKAHHGSIAVDSAPWKGTTFTLALPVARAVALVVDDQEAVRQEMAEHIRAMGAEVLEAANGREAMEILEETFPQVVITDVVMPVMDGWELLKLIRQVYPPEALPVIVMTSSGEREAREVAFSLGASDFATKPVIADDFIPRVKRYIG